MSLARQVVVSKKGKTLTASSGEVTVASPPENDKKPKGAFFGLREAGRRLGAQGQERPTSWKTGRSRFSDTRGARNFAVREFPKLRSFRVSLAFRQRICALNYGSAACALRGQGRRRGHKEFGDTAARDLKLE